MLDDWKAESRDDQLPLREAIEYLCETLSEERRDRRLGEGVFLSTVHSVKGMEFNHVFILDGGWDHTGNGAPSEEERRLYYVAMTRARETLCLIRRDECRNPFVDTLHGDFLIHRRPDFPEPAPLDADKRYALLGLQDINLSYAARYPESHPIHRRLADLECGDLLQLAPRGDNLFLMKQNASLAALSKAARSLWRERLNRVEAVRVLAMIRRYRDDSDEEYRDRHQVETWEVPMVEVLYRDDRMGRSPVRVRHARDAS